MKRFLGGQQKALKQLHLDLGQRDFGSTKCPTCGMLYTKGDPADEALHQEMHKKAHRDPTLDMKWKAHGQERIVYSEGPKKSHIIMVQPTDPKAQLKKVTDACTLLEESMGLCGGWILQGFLAEHDRVGRGGGKSAGAPNSSSCRAFLYISSSKQLIGVLVVETTRQAYPAMPPSCRSKRSKMAMPPSSGQNGLHQPAQSFASSEETKRSILKDAGTGSSAPTHQLDRAFSDLPTGAEKGHAEEKAAGEVSCVVGTMNDRPSRPSTAMAGNPGVENIPAADGLITETASCHEKPGVPDGGDIGEQRAPLIARDEGLNKAAWSQSLCWNAAQRDDQVSKQLKRSLSGTAQHEAQHCTKRSASERAPEEQALVVEPDLSQKRQESSCAVRLAWVAPQVRQKGFARKMIDIARCNMVYGFTIPRHTVAFHAGQSASAVPFISSWAKGLGSVLLYQDHDDVA